MLYDDLRLADNLTQFSFNLYSKIMQLENISHRKLRRMITESFLFHDTCDMNE